MNQRNDLTICIYNGDIHRLRLIRFYKFELGRAISLRHIFVELLIEHVKNTFKIDPLQIKGSQKAAGIVLLSVLLYQIIVCYNYKTRKGRPKAIKYMLGN